MLWRSRIDPLPVIRAHENCLPRLPELGVAPFEPDPAGTWADANAVHIAPRPLHQQIHIEIHHAPPPKVRPLDFLVSHAEGENIHPRKNTLTRGKLIPAMGADVTGLLAFGLRQSGFEDGT